jgi:hypothetical protein
MPQLKDMNSWTDRLGHSKLRTFTDEHGHFWLEQNAAKPSKWAKLAREGHQVAWEFESPVRDISGTNVDQRGDLCAFGGDEEVHQGEG